MKKIIMIFALTTIISGCTNQNAPSTNQIADNNKTVDIVEEEKQVIDVNPSKDTNDTEETNTESEDVVQNDVDEETNESEEAIENEEADSDDTEETDDKAENKEESEDKETVEASNEAVEPSDLFFLPYSSIVTINEDGDVVDENGESTPSDPAGIYNYVKYSNNIFIRNDSIASDFKIVRMNKKDMTTLYEFPDGEEFRPLGLIGDKIYGYHDYYVYDEEKDLMVLESDQRAIGVVDLATGEVHDFSATKGASTGGATVIEGELQFTMPGDQFPANAYSYDLYKLDLSKGYDQEPELLEKDFDLQYLFGQKRFIDGKADWKIRRADNENIYVDDNKFPFLWAETGFQDFVGNNIFYFTSDFEAGEDYYPHVQKLEIVNTESAETVLDTTIRGLKLKDGKLYYITTDGDIESIELDL